MILRIRIEEVVVARAKEGLEGEDPSRTMKNQTEKRVMKVSLAIEGGLEEEEEMEGVDQVEEP